MNFVSAFACPTLPVMVAGAPNRIPSPQLPSLRLAGTTPHLSSWCVVLFDIDVASPTKSQNVASKRRATNSQFELWLPIRFHQV